VKRIIPICMLIIMVLCLASAAYSQEGEEATKETEEAVPGKSDTLLWAEANFHYVGEKKCKICHSKEFKSWETTPHANAWDTLSAEEQKNPECIQCHITGMTEDTTMLVNVGCEVCHGPGSDYRKMKIMKDPKQAAANGLLPVTEATCVRCHNKKSPMFKSFDYAEALKKGVHEHFPKEEKK
jgi:hypothetical protein